MNPQIELPPWTEKPDTPFSLACNDCDAGTDVPSMAAALVLDWQDVHYDSWGDDMPWNYLGDCPDCQREKLKGQTLLLFQDRLT